MKKILLVIFLFTSISKAQDTNRIKSKLEEFSSEKGVLYKTETEKLGKVKGFSVIKTTVTNVEKAKSVKAIQITEKPGFLGYGAGIVTIDEEIIPEVIKVLDYYKNNVIPDQCKDYCASWNFKSTSGTISITCYKIIGAYASKWHTLIYDYDYWSLSLLKYNLLGIDLEPKELDEIIAFLKAYK